MATNDIILMKLDASSDWQQIAVTAEANKALAFDGSVLPVMITPLQNLVEDTTPQLGGDLDLNGKVLSLGAVLTSNATWAGIAITGTVDTNSVGAGALLAIGSDGNWDEADADAIANCYMLAIATAAGTGSKTLLLYGQVCFTAWNWTVGTPIYVSTTLGTMSQTAVSGTDDVSVIVGFALSADTIFFCPYAGYVTKT